MRKMDKKWEYFDEYWDEKGKIDFENYVESKNI